MSNQQDVEQKAREFLKDEDGRLGSTYQIMAAFAIEYAREQAEKCYNCNAEPSTRCAKCFHEVEDELQTLRGENERLRDTASQELSEAVGLATDLRVERDQIRQEKAALEARERALREAAEGARSILTTCRRLYGGSGLGGPAALEADCDFAIRKLDAALAPRPRHE